MATFSESGHAINISNFKLLIDTCTGFAGGYQPSNPDLVIAAMTAKWTNATAIHDALTASLMTSKDPINDRELLFAPLNKRITRVMNYLDSTKASASFKKDARGFADVIRGKNLSGKAKKLADGSLNPEFVSTSHMSYIMRLDNLKKLVVLLGTNANYAPNEADLRMAELNLLVNEMSAMNDGIGSIISPLNQLRIDRNVALYEPETGIYSVSLACKKYVRGVFGAKSAQAALVGAIKFRNMTI